MQIWIDLDQEEFDGTIENLIDLCGYSNERSRNFVEIKKIKEVIESNNLNISLKDCIEFCKKNYYECEKGKFHTNLNP